MRQKVSHFDANLTIMEKLEHIGIAVKDLKQANELFAKLLGRPHYKVEEVESEGVKTSFFEVGGVKIELLEASREDSPIAKFIDQSIQHYEKQGFVPINPKAKKGADNKLICFLHPKSTGGVLIELCQDVSTSSTWH